MKEEIKIETKLTVEKVNDILQDGFESYQRVFNAIYEGVRNYSKYRILPAIEERFKEGRNEKKRYSIDEKLK